MKKFKEFLKEQPTNSVGNGGYTGSGGANVAGYEIGGKTGTAQKSLSGGYSNKKINSL